jgi:hypothetical protein
VGRVEVVELGAAVGSIQSTGREAGCEGQAPVDARPLAGVRLVLGLGFLLVVVFRSAITAAAAAACDTIQQGFQ